MEEVSLHSSSAHGKDRVCGEHSYDMHVSVCFLVSWRGLEQCRCLSEDFIIIHYH
ncbi:hypothetical protein OIU77_015000 [Salix suchowensis]|uniref:Uncharacterized protein n=1 Tax=Salix suchowensis TaxID=1278906 RepID=A0ABQ8ZZ53_9ROSI|nr:hypothetical protein OIU77_015000 [Salix suchowensis]